MRRGKEQATATTVSLPETRNWRGNDTTQNNFSSGDRGDGGGGRGWLERGKPGGIRRGN